MIGIVLIIVGSLFGRVFGGDGSPGPVDPAPGPAAGSADAGPTDGEVGIGGAGDPGEGGDRPPGDAVADDAGAGDGGAATSGGVNGGAALGGDEGALAAGLDATGAIADDLSSEPDSAIADTSSLTVPTADTPARVLIMGDSGGGTFGPYLEQLLGQTRIVTSQLEYKVSSGLARPDFYDWHAALAEKVPAFAPDIVVITFGGNDGQFLADPSGRSVVGQASSGSENDQDGVTVVWVGIPNHADPDVRFRMQVQDQAVKAELADWPEVRFVDAWSRFEGRNGGFAQFLIDPRDGVGKSVRASDGFHLNQTGAEILAIDIAGVVFDVLRERGADI
ncbi:MAG: DUF459 domain-containing protein [Nocardiopsis sp. BM-2018]|nr:MAG: DUF459 domain-containing protein [Nocardiopsis sp. BM-2018]